jgi:AcrR family transcriptional regulator
MTIDDVGGKRRIRLTGAERREKILGVAAELFAAKGFHETSVSEIAEAAGISKIVLYDHFASKEELFIEITKAARDGLLARGRERMAASGTFEDRLRAAVEAFFSYVEEQPAQARVLLLAPKGEPQLRDMVAAIQEEGTRGLSGLLAAEESLLTGAPDRAERLVLITEFIKIGLRGLVEWWADHPDIPREKLVAAAMDVAWTGLGALRR